MNTPRVIPISSSEINVTWTTPDLVTEVRGNILMFEVVVTVNNTGNEWAPAYEDKVGLLYLNTNCIIFLLN